MGATSKQLQLVAPEYGPHLMLVAAGFGWTDPDGRTSFYRRILRFSRLLWMFGEGLMVPRGGIEPPTP
jgi:hypothetical protein